VGSCYNGIECAAHGGVNGGYCVAPQGVCCVHVNHGKSDLSTASKLSYFYNAEWPKNGNGSLLSTHTVRVMQDTCFVR
jgi:hypothetical protein